MIWFRGKLSVILFSLQGIFLAIYILFLEHTDTKSDFSYAVFQDIRTLLYIGIGLLLSCLKHYAFSGISYNLLATVVGVQWSWIVLGLFQRGIIDTYPIKMDYSILINGDFVVANALISHCVIIGRISHIQLVLMTLMEIPIAEVNEFFGKHILKAQDPGDGIFIHYFSAIFGIAVSRVLYTEDIEESPKQVSTYHSDIFGMLGTLILWVYWPSFNGAVGEGIVQQKIVCNTIMSLCAATIAVFAMSSLLEKEGKLNMVHIQNATLAGGVAVSSCVTIIQRPYQAHILGLLGGTVSVLGYKYLQPFLFKKLKIHDAGGVMSLHALPGLVAGLGAALFAYLATEEKYGAALYELYPARKAEAEARSGLQQFYFQLALIGSTTLIALFGGLITGFLMRLPMWNQPKGDDLFDDKRYWLLPEEHDTALDKSRSSLRDQFTY
ncbi:ammonium transporter Rh type A-like [Argonauta hians]